MQGWVKLYTISTPQVRPLHKLLFVLWLCSCATFYITSLAVYSNMRAGCAHSYYIYAIHKIAAQTSYIPYTTKSSQEKISPKASALYWDKNFTKFNFANSPRPRQEVVCGASIPP